MHIAISTGTFYQVPFAKTLEMIKQAGFEYIEILQFWTGGFWRMGQHLKDITPKETLKMVRESGLKISSLHDGGGAVASEGESLIAPSTYEFLEYGAGEIPCVVFHLPIVKKTGGPGQAVDSDWKQAYRETAGRDLRAVKDVLVCLENVPKANDAYQPLITRPEDLLRFAEENDVFVNIDLSHYAAEGMDICEAARVLKNRVRTVHLNDYEHPNQHVYLGEGTLDLHGFVNELDLTALHALTLECKVKYDAENVGNTVERMRNLLGIAKQLTSEY